MYENSKFEKLSSTKIHRRRHRCHYVSFASEVDKKPYEEEEKT